ncbi:MAG: hypothetical protein ABIT01_07870 [Thermoanaerobaculia bacterium]
MTLQPLVLLVLSSPLFLRHQASAQNTARTSPPSSSSAARAPDVATGLKIERERLAGFQWRLKTEMKVDGLLRIVRVEDVHLGPDGGLVRGKTVKYDKKPQPTPLPFKDPRLALGPPATDKEDEAFFEQAQDLMQFYFRLSPERIGQWAASAERLGADPDRPGKVRLHGRGLGRPFDDALVYLNAETKAPTEIEVKTTINPLMVNIAFIRLFIEPFTPPEAGAAPLLVPKRVFLTMDRGRRHAAVEMEMSDFRSWP